MRECTPENLLTESVYEVEFRITLRVRTSNAKKVPKKKYRLLRNTPSCACRAKPQFQATILR